MSPVKRQSSPSDPSSVCYPVGVHENRVRTGLSMDEDVSSELIRSEILPRLTLTRYEDCR